MTFVLGQVRSAAVNTSEFIGEIELEESHAAKGGFHLSLITHVPDGQKVGH